MLLQPNQIKYYPGLFWQVERAHLFRAALFHLDTDRNEEPTIRIFKLLGCLFKILRQFNVLILQIQTLNQ